MRYPEVGDIWKYPSSLSEQVFLVLGVKPQPEGSDYLVLANLLCLETGSYYEDYSWPDHTWIKLA